MTDEDRTEELRVRGSLAEMILNLQDVEGLFRLAERQLKVCEETLLELPVYTDVAEGRDFGELRSLSRRGELVTETLAERMIQRLNQRTNEGETDAADDGQ